jgi:hypothetical protein|tara:strand:+ start:481 stop:693 length:213 start_codon:yes stop_codon:yes gene_type:complete
MSKYIVSDDNNEVVDMREEAAEYFSHNPNAKRVAFMMLDEHDMDDVENDLSLSMNDYFVFINGNKENENV